MATNTEERREGEAAQSTRRASSYRSQQRRQRRRPGGGRRRKKCAFCADKRARIDYKAADELRRYLTDRGKILPRRATGVCARHQRRLALAIKRARHLALLPFTAELQP